MALKLHLSRRGADPRRQKNKGEEQSEKTHPDQGRTQRNRPSFRHGNRVEEHLDKHQENPGDKQVLKWLEQKCPERFHHKLIRRKFKIVVFWCSVWLRCRVGQK